MRAAVFKEKGILKVEDISDPIVGPRDVLLKVTHCAICGSDLHHYSHGMLRPGAILGHEHSGTVADKGTDVDAFQIGERVVRSGGKINPWHDVVVRNYYRAQVMRPASQGHTHDGVRRGSAVPRPACPLGDDGRRSGTRAVQAVPPAGQDRGGREGARLR
jgi:threonine dehydrogenase-like Zn-dependent dehydrogenase